VVLSVASDWPGRLKFDARQGQMIFLLSSRAHLSSYPMSTGGPYPGEIVQLGHDADHSPKYPYGM
jgi:hypothetical protein